MQFGNITIIGLGLIGGSLAWALKKSGGAGQIIGVDSDPLSIEVALQKGIIDKACSSTDDHSVLPDRCRSAGCHRPVHRRDHGVGLW